jgi:hypothetical protein
MLSTLKQRDEVGYIKKFATRIPVNIEAAIRELGLVLRKNADDLAPEISGQIKRLTDGGYEIATNAREHYFRQRFTMAHELGHYILHRDLIGEGLDDDTMYRSTPAGNFYNTRIRQVHEAQANSFAANFLMPSDKVLEEVAKEVVPTVKGLATKFQVSPSAMRWRLKSLGLNISDGSASSAGSASLSA